MINTIAPYQWLYLYGFVCPQSGQTYWLVLPTVNKKVFNLALSHFAREVGACKDKQLILILDGAGWHKRAEVEIPDGIHFIFLPAYSPELQPAEKRWPLTNQGIANRHFSDLAELEETQIQGCLALQQQTALVKGHTFFNWWPKLAC